MENVTFLLENLCHLQTHKQKAKETKEVNEKENVAVKNSSVENLTQ